MAYSPIFGCRELGDPSDPGEQTEHSDGGSDTPLDPLDYQILTLHLLGHSKLEIASLVGITRVEVEARMTAEAFLGLLRAVEVRTVDRVGELTAVEPVTKAKAAAPEAMGTIIRLSRVSQDPRVRLKAAEGVLRYAGVEPPRKIELTAPDRLLDQMTALELAALADKKLWPARFKDQLRHLLPAPPAGPGETIIDTHPLPPRGVGTPQKHRKLPEDDTPPEGDGDIDLSMFPTGKQGAKR